LNAEIVINADGALTVALDLRGTFNMTFDMVGSVDGTNWTLLAVRSMAGGSCLAAVAGAWEAALAGFAKFRLRVTASTSGAATATLLTATSLLDDHLPGKVSSPAQRYSRRHARCTPRWALPRNAGKSHQSLWKCTRAKNRNADQAKPATGNPPDPSGST